LNTQGSAVFLGSCSAVARLVSIARSRESDLS
jgi:hypothetical protein